MKKHRHFLVYKPYYMVSQFVTKDSKQKRKRFLKDLGDFPDGTMAVGRLDEKSEGLLLLTTDGKLSDTINRSKKIGKVYCAQLDGLIDDQAIQELKKGVYIGINGKKYLTQPCDVSRIDAPENLPPTRQKIRDDRHGPTSWIQITLFEGKFRQVRKMTSAVGFPTLRLARVQIGKLTIQNLNGNEVLEITDEQIEALLMNKIIP